MEYHIMITRRYDIFLFCTIFRNSVKFKSSDTNVSRYDNNSNKIDPNKLIVL